jgi:hypothetical protein
LNAIEKRAYTYYYLIRITTHNAKQILKPDKICVTILHVQTHAGNIDVSCWIVVVSCSDVPIFVVSTVDSRLMVVTIIVVCDRCVVIDEYSLHVYGRN